MDADDPVDEPMAELPQCRRFRRNLALYVSNEDLAISDREIRQHLDVCSQCQHELELYRRQHRLLGEYGQVLRHDTIGRDPSLWEGLEGRLSRRENLIRGPWSSAR
jgi:hypothetical protein